ncbi:efflux RND transporter periplasmic adaptor subunit [Neoroseomonas oryzicola]|uniref:HlyD family efflux transporter periplasmic adaptor subunit n=1 Tax=Neoroseomonas oryzicola TaxID=535904 RepID=A0A9X9WJY4_9PROT|nr:HlyD family efflux transporter periplasmic adaptor subunit [Neoroseomonas oryzicola]MBR0660644.1 HlyD family efflux transporter periplasmic adaptor subunit [Neoroseomonas oryzicola]NKE19998.1 HlyD family efflux transporter periplasmic adaptor subunit [Neoroseomonas oryzicola]
MGRHLRRALIAASVLLAACGAFLALRPGPLLVEAAQVTRGRFAAVVEEDGRTRVRDRYIVSAPVAGRVLRLAVRPGDTVGRGDPVALILVAPSALLSPRARREAEERVGAAEAMLQQAGALVERAAAQQVQAEAEATRVRALLARGAAPFQQLERADLAERSAARDMLAAERRRYAAEHELERARALLTATEAMENGPDRQEIRAPVAGQILRVLQESEAVVAAGTPLLELGDPADLEVVVDVLTTVAVGIVPGAPVAIERWGGPAPLQGRVRRVEPGAFTRVSALGVEEQRVWVVIDLVGPREGSAALGDGFRVDARITVEEIEDAVLVPVSALFRRGGGWAVFVVQDGAARERRVDIASRAARSAMVADGLAPGETVILFPPSALRDGARVRTAR